MSDIIKRIESADLTPEEFNKISSELAEYNELENEIRKRKARQNVNDFIEYVIKDKETKLPVIQGDIHRFVQKELSEYQRVMIGLPREHGKTTQLIGKILDELGRNPDLRIKIISANDVQAGKRVTAIKNHIEFNKQYHEIYPDVKPMYGHWGKTSFTIEREIIDANPTLEGAGVLSTGTGDRADWIIFDDPCDMKNSILDSAQRPKVYESIVNVWLNLLAPSGRVSWLFTPWHNDDAAARFKKDRIFEVIERYVDKQFTPVWPEKWGKEQLIERWKTIKDRAFGRGFRGEELSDEEKVFKNIHAYRDYDISMEDVEETPGQFTIAGVDLAISKRKDSAYTVIFGLKVDEDGNKAPVNILRKKIGSTATAAWILYCWIRYDYDTIVVEGNAYQQSIDEWIEFFHNSLKQYVKVDKDEKGRPIYKVDEEGLDKVYTNNKSLSSDITPVEWHDMKPYLVRGCLGTPYVKSFITGRNKADEVIGLPGLAADISSGSWVIPSKGCEIGCECEICSWVNEMDGYQMDGTSVTTKDIIMAAWFASGEVRSGDIGIRMV